MNRAKMKILRLFAVSLIVCALESRAQERPTGEKSPSVASFCKRAEAGERLTVVFFGCSLTWGANATDPNRTSWRALVGKRMESAYPKAHFSFVDAAIGGTDSQLGVFRVDRDVVAYKPDLVFVDFTVNDGIYDANDNKSCSYEGIVRRLLTRLPDCVLVQVILPVRKTMTEDAPEILRRRDEHIRLGERYNLTRTDVLRRCRELYAKGMLRPDEMWPKAIGDVIHPHDIGYGIYADIVWNDVFANPSDRVPTLAPTTLFAPKYEKVCRRRLFDLPMPSGWRKDYNKMRAGTFDFLCSRWQDGVANAESNAAPFRLRFRGEELFLFGESTVKGGCCEIIVDGRSRGVQDLSEFARHFDPSAWFTWQVCDGLDPMREHELEIVPRFSNGGCEVRIESVCVAGREAAAVCVTECEGR